MTTQNTVNLRQQVERDPQAFIDGIDSRLQQITERVQRGEPIQATPDLVVALSQTLMVLRFVTEQQRVTQRG